MKLTAEQVEKCLAAHNLPFPLQVEVHPTMESTNTYVKQAGDKGASEGLLVIAEKQTGGRGRRGRTFYSPEGTGLYMSLLLKPDVIPEDALHITTCAAVAAAEAIEAISGRKTGIKWVNDVFMDGRKVCGILTESALSAEQGKLQYAVLGIGVNIFVPADDFPEDIRTIAGAVFTKKPEEDTRATLAAEIVARFLRYYPTLGQKEYMQAYRDRMILFGKTVIVHSAGGEVLGEGQCLDLDEELGLVVRMTDGEIRTLSTGEVSIRGDF
ncbi:MAG: biotin--[Clostridia bacterium]|nr:biotin--[acetyl-CoA-carboxylase] ligase [Clostridia bacterium]